MPERRLDLDSAAADEIHRCVTAALAGDDAELQRLLAAIQPVVHVRVLRAVLRRRGEARGRDLRVDLEDLVQEAFAALFAHRGKALTSWDPTRGLSFSNFVGFLAEREVAMRMRTGRRNPWTEDPTLDTTLVFLGGEAESVETRLESRDVLRALSERLRERLSPQGRQYFQLLLVEEQPVQEVSARTGTSVDALYAWRSRLRRLLRELRTEIMGEEALDG
ncbi:MAG: sigma-70 family RNA polymerase sigma factor [Deltaproteobacteria bacterium]|nr:sigma-70 family RNA polymerase sigma factor [Deltaproteobacteria bacterium]